MAQTIDLGLVRGVDLLSAYPVGSFYISAESTSPASLFGGTWEQIKDTFLLAAGDTYAAGATGGAATHTLTVNQMPSHRHLMQYSTDGGETFATMNIGRDGSSANEKYGGVSNAVMGFASYQTQIGYTGGGAAHNNMPPYLAAYIWTRVS